MDRVTQPHVLLVEDEALIRTMTALALADNGFCVHSVANAAAALDHLAGQSPVDILFTDLDLGDAIGGEALARAVRALRPGVGVLYASGSAIGVTTPVAGSAFLAKPYDLDAVCATLTRLADGRAITPPPTLSRFRTLPRPMCHDDAGRAISAHRALLPSP